MTVQTRDRLDAGYAECARLTRAYGTTYYWGTALLPRARDGRVSSEGLLPGGANAASVHADAPDPSCGCD